MNITSKTDAITLPDFRLIKSIIAASLISDVFHYTDLSSVYKLHAFDFDTSKLPAACFALAVVATLTSLHRCILGSLLYGNLRMCLGRFSRQGMSETATTRRTSPRAPLCRRTNRTSPISQRLSPPQGHSVLRLLPPPSRHPSPF